VGHLQVTKIYREENYTEYDHSIDAYSKLSQTYTMITLCYSFPLYKFLRPEDGPQWPKHVVVSIINRIQDSCVLTYPTPSLIAYNTTGDDAPKEYGISYDMKLMYTAFSFKVTAA